MPKNEFELTARAQAIQNLLTGLSGAALRDLGPHLNCYECEVLAGVFLTHGHKEQFDALMAGHALADEEGDLQEHVEIKRELERQAAQRQSATAAGRAETMIVASPPTDEPLIAGLCAALNKAIAARFYIALTHAQGVSGFHAKGATLKAAKAEARAHLGRYPCWQRARVYDCERGVEAKLRATITNKPLESKRRCKKCGKPERIRSLGGIRFSNIARHLGLCPDCINKIVKS